MAAPTAQVLVQELGQRLGEFVASSPSSGTTTTLVDVLLGQEWPQAIGSAKAPLACYVFGTPTADTANRAVERRALSFDPTTNTLTFLTAWPGAIGTGAYAIFKRHSRARLLEAINSGVRQLGLYWMRQVMDESSIVTAVNTWQYTLPSTVNWRDFNKLQVQINTTAGLTGYPYVDGALWNAAVFPFVDSAGVTTWRMQFAVQPPPGRIIRIFGEANYTDLVSDADVLPLANYDVGPAEEWLYSWATCQVKRWDAISQPQNQTTWLEQQVQALLKEAEDLRQRLSHEQRPYSLVLPGRGDGTWPANGMSEDPAYLAAYRTIH